MTCRRHPYKGEVFRVLGSVGDEKVSFTAQEANQRTTPRAPPRKGKGNGNGLAKQRAEKSSVQPRVVDDKSPACHHKPSRFVSHGLDLGSQRTQRGSRSHSSASTCPRWGRREWRTRGEEVGALLVMSLPCFRSCGQRSAAPRTFYLPLPRNYIMKYSYELPAPRSTCWGAPFGKRTQVQDPPWDPALDPDPLIPPPPLPRLVT